MNTQFTSKCVALSFFLWKINCTYKILVRKISLVRICTTQILQKYQKIYIFEIYVVSNNESCFALWIKSRLYICIFMFLISYFSTVPPSYLILILCLPTSFEYYPSGLLIYNFKQELWISNFIIFTYKITPVTPFYCPILVIKYY